LKIPNPLSEWQKEPANTVGKFLLIVGYLIWLLFDLWKFLEDINTKINGAKIQSVIMNIESGKSFRATSKLYFVRTLNPTCEFAFYHMPFTAVGDQAVSYTHLTLPTICSV